MISERVKRYFEENEGNEFLGPIADARLTAATAFLAALVRSGMDQTNDKYAVSRAVQLADKLLEELAVGQ